MIRPSSSSTIDSSTGVKVLHEGHHLPLLAVLRGPVRTSKASYEGDVLGCAHEEEVIEFGGAFERGEDSIGVYAAGDGGGFLLLAWNGRDGT